MNESFVRNPLGIGLIVVILILLVLLFILWSRLQQQNQPPSPPTPPSPPEPPSPRDETSRYHTHFVPGQINLFARHQPRLSADRIVRYLRDSYVLEGKIGELLRLSPDRIVTFDDGDEAFSLVFADVQGALEENKLLSFLKDLNGRIGAPNKQAPLDLRQATPNWLSPGAPASDGTGGPGGKPVAAGRLPVRMALPRKLPLKKTAEQCGEAVDVFILDTAPCDIDLKLAYQKWVEEPISRGEEPHPILEALVGRAGALGSIYGDLRIEYAGHTHLLELANVFLPDHDYVMSDHGLFIAGIVNNFAPAARLHLIEVLNPYGVGTLETIARGFARAADFALAHKGAKVVVNASLFLAVGQDDQASLEALAQLDPFWASFLRDQIGITVAPLRVICEFLQKHTAKIVAAAGNDGRMIEQRQTNQVVEFHPKARVPAAYPTVIGVAALNHNNTAALYTNEADIPLTDGVAAYGGDKTGDHADVNFGMPGVYIGSFPDGTPNEFGMARWAGTSFAAPVITAAVAALRCEGFTPDQAFEEIQKVPFTPESLAVGEIFPVT